MASIRQLTVTPAPLPESWTAPEASKKSISHEGLMIDNLSALVERKLLPAGAAYLAHVRRQVHNLSYEEIDRQAEEERKRLAAANGDDNGEDDLGVGEEEESEELLAQDAKEWKKEDIARLRGLVDLTLGLDPRIKRIKQEEKEAREAKKKAKNPAVDNKAKLEEEKKKAEEDAKKKEEEDKIARAEAKKAKLAAANAAKKARRQQRTAEDGTPEA
ncbi:hypothetical protein HWV62_45466 [Athelia sp. TMB]|nr:hypothetical protein HWV62_8225 [Athelia sp. TMB]KAF7978552.1 hypothetical protein HWV62_45466 [Athelia sp. TMB]